MPASLVFFVVVALSLLAATVVHRIIERQIEARMVLSSDMLVDSIRDGVLDVNQHLSSIAALFEASDEVTGDEYLRFTNEMGLGKGMRGIGFMPIVAGPDIESFQERMAEVLPGYEVFEVDVDGNRVRVSARAVYFPIQFFEPSDVLGRPLGLDGGSPPGRIRYLVEAVTTGREIATPFVPLATNGEEGLVVYYPTVSASGTVMGLVMAPLVLSDLMSEWAPPGMDKVLTWTIRDVTDSVPTQEGLEAADRDAPILPPTVEGMVQSETIEVAGRIWQIDATPAPGSLLSVDSRPSRWIVVVGVVMGLLAGAAVYFFMRKVDALHRVAFLSDVIEAKNHFIAALSHKIGTPLTSVLGFAEILRDERDQMSSVEQGELIDALADEASNLATIHEDLVVLGRAEYGILSVEAVPVDVEREIEIVLGELDLVETVSVLATDARIRAVGDPSQVRRILRHIVTNAVAYGGPNVSITTHVVERLVVVSVIDDGDGVLSDHSWDVFEPYLREHDAMVGNPQSIGLGLSVSRSLAQHMGGDLTYRRVDATTVFELTLPADESRFVVERPLDRFEVGSRNP